MTDNRPIGLSEWFTLTREMLLQVYPEDLFPRSVEALNPGTAALAYVDLAWKAVGESLNGQRPVTPEAFKWNKDPKVGQALLGAVEDLRARVKEANQASSYTAASIEQRKLLASAGNLVYNFDRFMKG